MKQIVDFYQAQDLKKIGLDSYHWYDNTGCCTTIDALKSFPAPTIGELIEWIMAQGYMTFTIDVSHDDGSFDWAIQTYERNFSAHGFELIDALVALCLKIQETSACSKNRDH